MRIAPRLHTMKLHTPASALSREAGAGAPHAHEEHGSSCAACQSAHDGARQVAAAAAAPAKTGTPAKTHVVKMRMYMGKGSDGKVHALASHANFSVKAGEKVTLEITNEDDDMDHSFTSPALGIDEKLPHAKDGKPTVRTVTFTAKKAGNVEWYCSVPCDPKAMATNGMMRGTITVTK